MSHPLTRASLIVALVASFIAFAGCHGQSSAPNYAPANFAVVPGDGQVAVTWNQESGLTYWIFYIAGGTIATTNSGTSIIYNAQSPGAVTNLSNGTQYAFVMNATNRDSKGGPSTSVLTATPRLSGASWTSGSPISSQNLNGVVYGPSVILGVVTNMIVAVGDSGSIFSGPYNYFSSNPPGVTTWTQGNLPAGITSNFNGVVATGAAFLALGADGTILSSADAINWGLNATIQTGGATMNGLTYRGTASATLAAAVGTQGRLFTSVDTLNWTQATSNTTSDLYAVAYLSSGLFIAIGANGTLLTCTDGITWTAQTTHTTNALRGVTYGIDSAGAGYYVAVGDSGMILTSPDATNWTATASPTTQSLRSVVFGSRFLAVGMGGTAVYSDDAINWQLASAGSADLNGVAWTPAMYVAVGTAGANAIAK